jgi:hypothetical protein
MAKFNLSLCFFTNGLYLKSILSMQNAPNAVQDELDRQTITSTEVNFKMSLALEHLAKIASRAI